jgi:hypothetical protein
VKYEILEAQQCLLDALAQHAIFYIPFPTSTFILPTSMPVGSATGMEVGIEPSLKPL